MICWSEMNNIARSYSYNAVLRIMGMGGVLRPLINANIIFDLYQRNIYCFSWNKKSARNGMSRLQREIVMSFLD